MLRSRFGRGCDPCQFILMCFRYRRLFALVLGIVSMVSLIFVYRRTLILNSTSYKLRSSISRMESIDDPSQKYEEDFSAACRLPTLNPFHPSLVAFMKDLGKLRCRGVGFSSFENNVLKVQGEGITSAQYRKIERTPGNDFGVVLSSPASVGNIGQSRVADGNQKGFFLGNTSVDADFIRVDIVTSSGETNSDVHMHVLPKKEVLDRQQKPGGIPLNVALIMFDSTSAANFRRKMPNSLEYLTKSLDSILLQGETIVGDGTTAQLCAMLTGIDETRQPEARRKKASSETVDNWRWIFKDYKEKGYATMFSEDSPGLAAFNFRLHGFRDPPTDHYARPFWLEAENVIHGHCINSRASHNVSLNYLLSFFRSYKETPKFAFSSHAKISHGDINMIGYADDDLKAFLQTFEKESFLNNTLLIIFADHGARFSDLRKTIQGKLEERFPFLSITLPKWFPSYYPDLYNSLVHNSRVLTSPFDVYATLRHIISYPEYPSGIFVGQSLINRIDKKNRTCTNTGVADHWCPCLDLEEVLTNEPAVKETAAFVVRYINNLTSQSEELSQLCQRLSLKEIKSAFRDMPKEAMQRFQGTKNAADDACDACVAVMGDKAENTLERDTLYQLQVVTSPNEGFYEASVRIKKGVPSLVGDISRIDAYKDQPYCIEKEFPLLRKYCYCSPKTHVRE